MQKNDKMLCRILNYIPRERTFEVEELVSKTKGFVIFVNNYQNIPILKEAYKKGKNIPLYFDRYEGGNALFSYKEIIPEVVEVKPQVEIKALFSGIDKEFNTTLFDALLNSIGETIDTDEKYNLAKQLLQANKELKVRGGLAKDFFRMSSPLYQKKFWEEGILPYFSNLGIRKMWSEADEDEKDLIVQRLGIAIQPQNKTSVECHFEHIGEEVVKKIISAKKSIKIAMAWFTNFDIFRVIKHKLENSDVEITLVTNNDLINNGGYCLNFNELIGAGLKIYLYEYPDMLHHKFCIIDDELVMTGSYNWTFFSEAVNRENMLIIKDDDMVIDSFIDEFNYIINGRLAIDKMPDTVPDRPEYDRSSFKQYISEELVIRTRRRIGNARENISRAKTLSPSYASVARAIQDFNITLDNNNVSTQALESVAATTAIEERREQIASHQQHLQQLGTQRESLRTQQRVIIQRQQEVQAQAQQIAENEEISEEEKNDLQENVRQQEEQLHIEEEQLNNTLNEVEQVTTGLQQAVQEAQEEINTIQETSQIETQGGRGTLKINLKWNTTDDLDLHVFDPDGFEIYYSKKEHVCNGVKGQLDIDANATTPYTRTPQENIYWEEGKNAPIGKYKVQVVLYNKRDNVENIPFTVTIYPDKGETRTFTGRINAVKFPKDIVDFDYSENGIKYL
ncbi:phospholipase D-like domain-containing protein [Segatella bryantii]|uniref:phospholipase D-like domain-containing protein n=1 Tax=Segatella bryantii TaxID=77095 RepID=UPI00088EB4EB|nr:phospholipase D-like domain-containing protein [Segatella bryantii]SDM10412.1 PLD-like domain-containing protein [Segatella bryantii]